jgi:hypothetical protein
MDEALYRSFRRRELRLGKATIIINDFAGAIIPLLVSFLIVWSSCAKDVFHQIFFDAVSFLG